MLHFSNVETEFTSIYSYLESEDADVIKLNESIYPKIKNSIILEKQKKMSPDIPVYSWVSPCHLNSCIV